MNHPPLDPITHKLSKNVWYIGCSGHFKPLWLLMTLNGPKQLNGPKGRLIQPDTNDFWFFFMDFYVGRPCENFRRIQSYTILECKKRGHWRPFEIQLCGGQPAATCDQQGSRNYFLSANGNFLNRNCPWKCVNLIIGWLTTKHHKSVVLALHQCKSGYLSLKDII